MTDPKELPAISCPKGTFAVYNDGNVVTVALIDVFGLDNASGVIDSVNRVLETDRSQEWRYCLYVGKKALSTLDAENKFKQFIKFRKWLSGVMEHCCKVATVFEDGGNAVAHDQINRVLSESDISFRNFDTKEEAYRWLHVKFDH